MSSNTMGRRLGAAALRVGGKATATVPTQFGGGRWVARATFGASAACPCCRSASLSSCASLCLRVPTHGGGAVGIAGAWRPAGAAAADVVHRGGRTGAATRGVLLGRRGESGSPSMMTGRRYMSSVTVNFVDGDKTTTVSAPAGTSILELAHSNGIDLEGACEGSLACSTCHVILEEDVYEQLEEPTDEENDMLDLAFGLTDTSRLGCQVKLCEKLEGATLTIPSATRNFQVDK